MDFRADADVHEVPEQTPLIIKNTATVALQLLKRIRNILYANATGRIPPRDIDPGAVVADKANMTRPEVKALLEPPTVQVGK